MSFEIPGNCYTFESSVDLSGQQFRFVKRAGKLIDKVSATTDKVFGVLQNKPNRPMSNPGPGPSTGLGLGGERNAATVMVDGISRVVAGGAFAADAPLTVDAQGRVVAATGTAVVVAQAMEAATGANVLVAAMLKPLAGVTATA